VSARLPPARLVLPEGWVDGTLEIADGHIVGIEGDTPTETGDDAAGAREPVGGPVDGHYLIPGLIEPHTDNVERHLLPRPAARWPNALAALLAHDAEIAMSGITTVHDALRIGAHEGEARTRGELFGEVRDALAAGRERDVLRVDHRLHMRCELTDPTLPDMLEAFVDDSRVTILSLMDHTPGQRQWRDIASLLEHKGGSEAARRTIDIRMAAGQRHVAANRRAVLERVASRMAGGTLTVASHDDTTLEHVAEALDEGVRIAEFPCTLEAAVAGASHGQWNLGGAPNVVRGGSHSGNVSVAELARADVLHGLSSDYVPASLLQAVFRLVADGLYALPRAVALVTSAPAERLGLDDRGALVVGRRADLVRLDVVGGLPVVREVIVGGRRVA